LNETFIDERIAVNVYVEYWDGTTKKEIPMTYMGSPSDNAVTASRSVTLYNSTMLADGSANVSTAGASDDGLEPSASRADVGCQRAQRAILDVLIDGGQERNPRSEPSLLRGHDNLLV
jgi:hypothetical protein